MHLVKRIKESFKFEAPEYKEMTSVYGINDGILALVVSALLMLLTIVSALLMGHIIFVIILAITPFIILLYTKDNAQTLGFTKKNFIKSCMHGIYWGVPLFLILPTDRVWPWNLPYHTIIRTIYNLGEHFKSTSSVAGVISIVFFIFINAMLTAFTEEVFFRGYFQTRIYGIIKSDIFALLAGGFIFALFHMPHRIAIMHIQYDIPFSSQILSYLRHYFFLPSYLFLIVFHLLCVYLHRKYNSLVAPIVLHFFVSLRIGFGI